MPQRGFAGVRDAKADIDARKEAGGGDGRLWFKLPNSGDTARVRFLEQGEEVRWAWVHQLPPRGKQRFGDDIPCLDQDREGTACPSCEAGGDDAARSFSGYINLIWRDAPIYPTAEGQKWPDRSKPPIGHKDQVAVWNQGITVFDELAGKDATYKGLSSRDFVITRHGTGMNTTYSIDPYLVDGEPVSAPMSDADKELAKEKYSFDEDLTPKTYDEHKRLLHGGAPASNGQQDEGGVSSVPSDSPFLKS